ncbi:MAG: hypothetical protein HKN04_06170 [Rhodothermaceae bacterium]|nr:hypothetical protein [Rhodothermaceae bacterium]
MLLLTGCVQLFSSGQASVGAHAVFLTRPDCVTFVARTLDSGFTVAEVRGGDYTPALGDVFEGPNRTGQSVFRVFPPEDSVTRLGGTSVPLDVQGFGLPLAEARARLDAACGTSG